MTIALTTFNATVDRYIQDSLTVLDSDAVDDMIKSALQQYSKDVPDEDVVEFAGDGGQYYAITSLTNWVEGFSKIRMVEYPAAAVASDEQPQPLDSNECVIWEDATAKYLYFPSRSPSSTESVRVKYTVPYTFSESPSSTDIPVQDYYAICYLAASYCCDLLATYYATHVDVGDGRLKVNRDKVTAKYEELAKRYEQIYLKQMGLPLDGRPKAANIIGEWDVLPQGREYVHHPSYRR